jgi:hypothetical protein
MTAGRDPTQYYFSKPDLARRYGVTPRSIDRWRFVQKFPQPDLFLPNGQPRWLGKTVEAHERSLVPNAATAPP